VNKIYPRNSVKWYPAIHEKKMKVEPIKYRKYHNNVDQQEGLSILQYADGTIIFLDHDMSRATNLKLLLCAFEKLSCLK
jgi:hypothetical protein